MKRTFRKVISSVLAAAMLVTTMAAAMVSVNAEDRKITLNNCDTESDWTWHDAHAGITGGQEIWWELHSYVYCGTGTNLSGLKSLVINMEAGPDDAQNGGSGQYSSLFQVGTGDEGQIVLTSKPGQLWTSGAYESSAGFINDEAFTDYGCRVSAASLKQTLVNGDNTFAIDMSTAGSKFNAASVTGIFITAGGSGHDVNIYDISAICGDTATEQNKVSVSLGSVSGAPGDTVIVPVNIALGSDVTAAGGLQAAITYDASVVTPLESASFVANNIKSTNTLCVGNTDQSKVGTSKAEFAVISTSAISAGAWVNLKFKINSTAAAGAKGNITFNKVTVTDTMGNAYSNVVTAGGVITVASAATYTVSFDANGGTGAPASQTKTNGVSLTLNNAKPSYAGHTFLGWASSKTAATAQYQPGGTYTANASATLYAVWKADTYTVSYNANGGSGAPAAQTKIYGVNLTLSNTVPSWAGHTFRGWATTNNATSAQYTAGGSYTANSAATLYAVWSTDTYTVSFNANGGTGAPAAQTKTYGVNLALSNTIPSREGYSFLGWASTSNASSAQYAAGGSYTANAAATLYAVWSVNTYTVSYNANGGTGAPASQTKTYGQPLTLSSDKPSFSGYTFIGWANTNNATSAQYAAGGTFNTNANTTLYAVWQVVAPDTYIVMYDANGGENAPASQTKTKNIPLALSQSVPTRDGFIFMGWSTVKNSASVEYAAGSMYTANQGTVLYAVWQAMTYTVSYNANGGTGAPAAQAKVHGTNLLLSATVPVRSGYNFLGWSLSSDATTAEYAAGGNYNLEGTKTLYAVWAVIPANTYTVTYDANGGTGAPAAQVKTQNQPLVLSQTVPTRTGFDFMGWAEDNNATVAQYAAGTVFTNDANTILFAVWQSNVPVTYTVSYNANGGSGAPAAQVKNHGVALVIAADIPVRDGYRFLGWATDINAVTASYASGASYVADENATLYAVWEQIPAEKYTVTYDSNGGTGAIDTQTADKGTPVTVTTAVPVRTGYTFLGWADSADATTAQYASGSSYNADVTVTLYAVWQQDAPAAVYVTFDANGGSGAPSTEIRANGESFEINSTDTKRENYKLMGWATTADATEAEYAKDATYTVSTDVTLYAVWKLAGDVNSDGKVDSSDALMILQAAVKKATLNDVQKYIADVNNDGAQDSADALAILQYSVGKKATLG